MNIMTRHFKALYLSVFLLFISTLLSFLFLTSSSVSADTSATATATVTVGSACTLNSVLDTPHTATIPSGTNQSEIGKTTFTVVCNNTGGYSIYAIGYSNFEVGNTKLLATVNGALNSNYDINTGTNASGTPSSWAMKLTPSTNLTASNILNGFGSYSAVPSSYTKVATLVPTTTMVNTSSLEATYRVNIASTQPAGNYNGKVRYVMVDPNTNVPNEPKTCASSYICYFPNAGNTVDDTMSDQRFTVSLAASATLWASNFKRPGYGFVGWSDAYDYVANVGSESNPDAHIYGPNEEITFAAGQYQGTNNGLPLYAVWVKSEGNLQDWNGCSALGSGKVTALTDLRDGDTYAVAKLADDNCWMIENLRLDYDANFDESLSQGFGKSTTYGNFIGLAKPETANFDNSTTANSIYYSGTQSGTASINIGTTDYPSRRIPRYRNDNTNTDSTINANVNVSNMTGLDQNIYSYGNYYTWSAALANTIYYSSSTATDADGKTSETVNTSLCPAGWHLPTGTGSGEFGYLSNSLGGYKNANDIAQAMSNSTTPTGAEISNAFRKFPNNFVYSGYISSTQGGSIKYRGKEAYYWSSTALGNGSSHLFYGDFSDIRPGTYYSDNYKSNGGAIRCIILNVSS